MKKIVFIFLLLLFSNSCFAASGAGGDENKDNLYKSAEKLILRAKKLEKKDKVEKALSLYSKAFKQLEKAYAKDKKNPDILNYLGYTLRKAGDFKNAETY